MQILCIACDTEIRARDDLAGFPTLYSECEACRAELSQTVERLRDILATTRWDRPSEADL